MNIKTSFLILTIVLLFGNIANGQNAIAKFKYEEAEAAYEKDDYVTTLNKLTEAEGILKSTNPKIMYLRIMAQSRLIYYKGLDVVVNYDVLESTVKLSAKYLKDYESLPDNEDKYRDIYNVSERIAKYPKTVAEIEAGRKRPMKFITESDNNVLDFYKIKPNMKWEEYKTYNPQAVSLSTDFYQLKIDDNEETREWKLSRRREGKACWQHSSHNDDIEGLNEVVTTYGIVSDVKYRLRSSIDYTDVEKCFFEVMAEMEKRIVKGSLTRERERNGLSLKMTGTLEKKPDADISFIMTVGLRDFPSDKYNLNIIFYVEKRK